MARWESSWERAMSCPLSSSARREYSWAASAAAASASASSARWRSPLRVTSGAPAVTTSPLSKWTCSTVSLTFAVIVTDSLAVTVPSARTVSFQGCRSTRVAVTGTAAGPPPGPAGPSPQATSAVMERRTQAVRSRKGGIGIISRESRGTARAGRQADGAV